MVKGDPVRLIGEKGVLDDIFYFECFVGKFVKIRDGHGVFLRTVESRIIPEKGATQVSKEAETMNEPKGKEKSVETKQEAKPVAKPEVKSVVKPEEKPEEKLEVKKPAKQEKKEVADPTPFCVDTWIRENGGSAPVHLVKKSDKKFGKKELTTHVVVNEAGGLYYVLNIYKDEAGVFTTTGVQKNPLKGKKFTETVESKGQKLARQKVGKLTATEVIDQKIKDGYTRV